jgi:hypothetical protein
LTGPTRTSSPLIKGKNLVLLRAAKNPQRLLVAFASVVALALALALALVLALVLVLVLAFALAFLVVIPAGDLLLQLLFPAAKPISSG